MIDLPESRTNLELLGLIHLLFLRQKRKEGKFMDMVLKRTSCEQTGIYGIFSSAEGAWSCLTLEHAFFDEGQYHPKIPVGTWQCVRRLSPHFGIDVFCLVGVPGHSFLEIHVGNYNDDSDGCVLLGQSRIGNMIDNSRNTFDDFMRRQTGVNSFNLVVS